MAFDTMLAGTAVFKCLMRMTQEYPNKPVLTPNRFDAFMKWKAKLLRALVQHKQVDPAYVFAVVLASGK
jgi:hypothetical protein